jgi:phospholipase A1
VFKLRRLLRFFQGFILLGEGWNGGKSNLRLHVQLFSGYGDSLLDYNYKRTALSVGLSLLDF